MKQAAKPKKAAGMSDEAVRAKTGRGWSEWFRILDKAKAKQMEHKQIAEYLHKNHINSPWWSQMVTVAYEQERGLRQKHEKPAGFEISVSRTIPAPISAVYQAWKEKRKRDRWLKEPGIVIHKATPNKSVRITWTDGQKTVSVDFYSKGKDKTQVVVQHGKLPREKDAEQMKAYWAEALERLKALVTSQRH